MLTQERLKELLDYDPETGVFVWKVNKGPRAAVGTIAGTVDSYGYIRIQLDKKAYRAHRLVWFYVYGQWSEKELDHINRIKTDNRLENLRDVSQSENQWNRDKYKNNTSGFAGVCWHKHSKKWAAQISAFGRGKCLGYFDTLEAANAAYVAAKENLHKIGEER